ncbi:MAG: prolipoprotein diacylglyceryl transferase family protein, partial [Lentisphaerota bacterium]
MNPVCFTMGDRPIYWYGVMTACGFLATVIHWNLLGRRDHRPPGYGSDLGFWLMLTGILGARVAYVAANFGEYAANPLEILRIDKGGLVYYGGFLLASLCLYVMARLRREPLWS